jgi:hypothetical protein
MIDRDQTSTVPLVRRLIRSGGVVTVCHNRDGVKVPPASELAPYLTAGGAGTPGG